MNSGSKFQDYLDSVVNQVTSEHIIKTAQVKADTIDVNNVDTEGLLKLANVIKTINVEPTYKDLYSFVGGFYGQQ